jgi:UDP-3-O-[3-hydroxymyristoyl] glucosamine N-acyltransferase
MKIIGDGGHAKVVRDILRLRPRVAQMDATFVAVGDNAARKREVEKLGPDEKFTAIVAMQAIVSPAASYREGTLICEGAIVQAGAKIGRHCILNAGCIVTHDCIIEDYAHIAPGAVLCGGVHVGEGALVGVGVALEPSAIVPAWSIVKRERYAITVSSH